MALAFALLLEAFMRHLLNITASGLPNEIKITSPIQSVRKFEKNSGKILIGNLFFFSLVAGIEGLFVSISVFCDSDVVNICRKCGDGIGLDDILLKQNQTMESLSENERHVHRIEQEIRNFTSKIVANVSMMSEESKSLILVKKYDDIFLQTDKILYW